MLLLRVALVRDAHPSRKRRGEDGAPGVVVVLAAGLYNSLRFGRDDKQEKQEQQQRQQQILRYAQDDNVVEVGWS